MHRFPIIISLILIIVAVIAILFIVFSLRIEITQSEMIQSITAIIATAGALISAAFVIPAYLQSLRTFFEAHRPQLLVQVENVLKNEPDITSPVPITILRYRNITTNQFNGLTFHIRVHAFGHEIDLSDLFTPHMTMPGLDQRLRKFQPVALLNERGIYLNTEVRGQPPTELHIDYEYKYDGKVFRVTAQEYTWNVKDQIWEIK